MCIKVDFKMNLQASLVFVGILLVCWGAPSAAFTLEELDDLITNNMDSVCDMVDCVIPMNKDCPVDARWVEEIAAGGCCGGCVKFLQEAEGICTGKLDSNECEIPGVGFLDGPGYGICNPPSTVSFPLSSSFQSSLSRYIDPDGQEVYISNWCDLGMYCNDGRGTAICIVAPSWVTCLNTQQAYDRDVAMQNFTIYRDDYRYRPECQADGNYGPKQCKGSRVDSSKACICVDPSGNTLPGKAFNFENELFDNMNCLCSRRMYELELAGATEITLHCQSNGNYEPLQCQDGYCFCVFPENGTINGYQLPESAINLLPCFNQTTIGEMYLRQCDSEYHAHEVYSNTMLAKGIVIPPEASVSCNYDGSYAAQHCSGSSCSCYNKYNKDCITNGDEGCECFRDMLKFEEYGKDSSTLTCANVKGRYNEYQTVTSDDVINEVDSEGFKTSPTTRADCIYHMSGMMDECQTFGNYNEDAYCEQVCLDCPPSAFFFNYQEFYISDNCLDP